MNINKKRTTLFLILLSTPLLSWAQIEKWVDKNGKTHYGSRAPSDSSSQHVKTSKVSPAKLTAKKDSIILYSTSWCPYCKKARAYLKKNAIKFKEYDIEKNTVAKRNYELAGGRGVPFMIKGKSSVAGFSEEKYNKFLKP